MTQLGLAVIAGLAKPVASAFDAEPEDFWVACEKHAQAIRIEIAKVIGLREQVRAALEFLDQNAVAVALLPELLLARPADEGLRTAIGAASPDALTVVPQARFELERMIALALGSAEAIRLHASLERIDTLSAAVAAYKSMHDALHLLQPHLTLMRGVVADQARWREFKVYADIFRQQLRLIDAAGQRLADSGFARSLDFRDSIVGALDTLGAAATSGDIYGVGDAMSDLASRVEEGLNSVDVLMRNAAQDANAPFERALAFFEPMVPKAAGTMLEPLLASYVSFARQTSTELRSAVVEHGRWQRLDRQFDQLQRAVDDTGTSAAGQIDSLWRMTARGLTEICGAPPPSWATSMIALIGQAASDLAPPVSPPLADAARDRVKDLIDSGRTRFMAVDQSLLDWLEQSASKQPTLVSLLRGEVGTHG